MAFAKAFPKFDADKADKDLYEYMKHGKFSDLELPLGTPKWSQKEFSTHVLSPEEVRAARQTLTRAGQAYSKKPKTDSTDGRIAHALGLAGAIPNASVAR